MNTTSYIRLDGVIGIAAALVILGGITLGWHTWLGLGFAVPEIVASTIIGAWTIWMGSCLARLKPRKSQKHLFSSKCLITSVKLLG